jgi:putative acetyltransferase
VIRRARPEDAEAVVSIFRESRAEAMPWLPVLHTREQDVAFFHRALAGEAHVFELNSAVAGFIVLRADLLDALYVAPGLQGRGVGSALFRWAQEARPGGFRLWVFQENRGARRFYEVRGCRLIRETDGEGNQERTPDALYEWAPGAKSKREDCGPGRICGS